MLLGLIARTQTDHPQLEINLKAGLTATTLEMLKTNALDLGLCALPVQDPTFEVTPLFKESRFCLPALSDLRTT